MSEMRGKKLRGNGLFESSRMMLPEHRESLLERRRELARKTKPELDEQKLEQFRQLIGEAMETQGTVRITTYSPYREVVETGRIVRADGAHLYVENEGGTIRLTLKEIVEIEAV